MSAAAPGTVRDGYIGLGANLGDRRARLAEAIGGLGRGGAEVVGISDLYETEPVGLYEGPQPDFLNLVVAVRTALGPHQLLDLCKSLEAAAGRDFDAPRHGPRPLDADVLLLGDLELDDERLTIPHPGLGERRFVLAPLAELAPELVLAGGVTVSERLAALGGQRAERLGPLAAGSG